MAESKIYIYVFDNTGDVKVIKEPSTFPGSYTDALLNMAKELFGHCGDFLFIEEEALTDASTYPLFFLFKDRNTGMYTWDSYYHAKARFPNLDQLMDKAKAIHFLI